jgi:hypothetical protein
MVFIAIFNNISVISWRSDLLVEETRVPGENHRYLWTGPYVALRYGKTREFRVKSSGILGAKFNFTRNSRDLPYSQYLK